MLILLHECCWSLYITIQSEVCVGLEKAMFVQRLEGELKWVRLEEDSQRPTEEENKNSGKGDKYFSSGLLHGIPQSSLKNMLSRVALHTIFSRGRE